MGFQVAFESENVIAQSNVSRQRIPGGWSSNRKSSTGHFGVYARNDEHRIIGRTRTFSMNKKLSYRNQDALRIIWRRHLVNAYEVEAGTV